MKLIDNLLFKLKRPTTVDKIVVGMGNPGAEYENTRHNIGFKVLDELVKKYKITKEYHYLIRDRVLYIKPMVCINQTGETLKKALVELKIDASEAKILVLVDELLLPLGVARLRKESQPSRHNGIRDMILHFTDDFERLRIGIGEKPKELKTIKFVLTEFTLDENNKLWDGIYAAKALAKDWADPSPWS